MYKEYHTFSVLFLILFLQLIDKGHFQVFELTESSFDQYTRDKDIMLVEFFMPWCKHCQALQPEWEKAETVLETNREYVLGKVNCWESGKSLCDKLKIEMYPDIRLYRHGVFIQSFEGDRNAAAILDFIQRAQATTGTVDTSVELPKQQPPPLPPSVAPPPATSTTPPPLQPPASPKATGKPNQAFEPYQSLVPPPPPTVPLVPPRPETTPVAVPAQQTDQFAVQDTVSASLPVIGQMPANEQAPYQPPPVYYTTQQIQEVPQLPTSVQSTQQIPTSYQSSQQQPPGMKTPPQVAGQFVQQEPTLNVAVSSSQQANVPSNVDPYNYYGTFNYWPGFDVTSQTYNKAYSTSDQPLGNEVILPSIILPNSPPSSPSVSSAIQSSLPVVSSVPESLSLSVGSPGIISPLPAAPAAPIVSPGPPPPSAPAPLPPSAPAPPPPSAPAPPALPVPSPSISNQLSPFSLSLQSAPPQTPFIAAPPESQLPIPQQEISLQQPSEILQAQEQSSLQQQYQQTQQRLQPQLTSFLPIPQPRPPANLPVSLVPARLQQVPVPFPGENYDQYYRYLAYQQTHPSPPPPPPPPRSPPTLPPLQRPLPQRPQQNQHLAPSMWDAALRKERYTHQHFYPQLMLQQQRAAQQFLSNPLSNHYSMYIQSNNPRFRQIQTVDMPPFGTAQLLNGVDRGKGIPNMLGFYKPRAILHRPVYHPYSNFDPYGSSAYPGVVRSQRKDLLEHGKIERIQKYLRPSVYNLLRRKKPLARFIKRPIVRGRFVEASRVASSNAPPNYWSPSVRVFPGGINQQRKGLGTAIGRTKILENSKTHSFPITKYKALQIAKMRANTHSKGSFKYHINQLKKQQRVLFKPEQPKTDQALIRTKVPNFNAQDKVSRDRYNNKNNKNNKHFTKQNVKHEFTNPNLDTIQKAKLSHFFNSQPTEVHINSFMKPNKREPNLVGIWDKLFKFYTKYNEKDNKSKKNERDLQTKYVQNINAVESFLNLQSKSKDNNKEQKKVGEQRQFIQTVRLPETITSNTDQVQPEHGVPDIKPVQQLIQSVKLPESGVNLKTDHSVLLKDKNIQLKKNAHTKYLDKTDFVLKSISRTPKPWDKRAKVTFKLSKKSTIPRGEQRVIGIYGSLRRKRKRRKRKRSQDSEYNDSPTSDPSNDLYKIVLKIHKRIQKSPPFSKTTLSLIKPKIVANLQKMIRELQD